jgi:hypothetical protein
MILKDRFHHVPTKWQMTCFGDYRVKGFFYHHGHIACSTTTFTNCHGVTRQVAARNKAMEKWLRLGRREYQRKLNAKMLPRYRACSGQSKSKRQWGVCDEIVTWWRAETSDGKTKLFASFEAAEKLADDLNHAEGYPTRIERMEAVTSGG